MSKPLIRRGPDAQPAATADHVANVSAAGTISKQALLALLRSKVQINRNALDTTVEEQPELFRQAAEEHVYAVSRRDAAKDNLLRVDAREALHLRDDKYKDQKVTESRVNDEVLQSPAHLTAYSEYSSAKQEADEWSVLREAFEMRGKMLRELVGLYATGYFGTATGVSARETYLNERGQRSRDALQADRERR